jgi:hypothetical protein
LPPQGFKEGLPGSRVIGRDTFVASNRIAHQPVANFVVWPWQQVSVTILTSSATPL